MTISANNMISGCVRFAISSIKPVGDFKCGQCGWVGPNYKFAWRIAFDSGKICGPYCLICEPQTMEIET